ncbi:GNAT family N-acetyltransferase [Vibrio sp. JC009]|uniref:GNAT family N-acetyltransferase n=1 Tax=Vibrio sp. JC009 TaxID=2912314 RepID=UPI0023B11A5B|nr:GNAT family N-acetyltransferase [Vibrio sp. JC009]WED21718.1 GNAT family N-acetyltransferase [Vibrio sp. JC009]
MTKTRIEKLDSIKLPLVQKLYKSHYPSGKAKSNELIYVSYTENQMSGLFRLRNIDKWRLFTGMLVIPQYRRQGIAHQLMRYYQEQVIAANDYCFAYQHLEKFYAQHSFQTISAEELPAQLRTLFERYSNSGKSLIPMKSSF